MSEPDYRSFLDVDGDVYTVRVTRTDPGSDEPRVLLFGALSETDMEPAYLLISQLLQPLSALGYEEQS